MLAVEEIVRLCEADVSSKSNLGAVDLNGDLQPSGKWTLK